MVNLDNLFLRMNELRLSAKKVSEATGISTGNISDWKSGRSMPSATKLDILADYLECSVDYLLGRVDFPELVIKDEDGNYISKYKKEYTGEEIIKLIERSKNNARAAALGGGKVSVKKELTDDDLKKVMEILNSSEDK